MTAPWAATVYFLCFATSTACGLLLVRSYWRNRTPLLLWSAACFVLFALTNLLVVIDLIFLPEVDLKLFRSVVMLGAVATLLYGFIWEVD